MPANEEESRVREEGIEDLTLTTPSRYRKTGGEGLV